MVKSTAKEKDKIILFANLLSITIVIYLLLLVETISARVLFPVMWKGIRTLPPRSTKRMGQLVYSLPAVAPVVDPSLNGFIRHQQKYITSNARILSPTCSFSSRTRDFRESNCNSKRVMAPLWPLSTGLNIRGGGMLQNPLASISTSTRSEFTSVDTSEESILLQPITRITTKSDAQHALKVLFAHKDVFWACDTEVADIDLKVEGKFHKNV